VNRLSLILLAAGHGTRFGGPKQLSAVGPNEEILSAYTIFDAIRAGIQHIVIVTRDSCVDLLKAELCPMIDGLGASLSIVVQADRPEHPAGSWGTAHAVLSAQGLIGARFGVANGDDWYGPTAHQVLADALKTDLDNSGTHCLVTYPIVNTLVDTQRVSRARCTVRDDGSLMEIRELLDVHTADGRVLAFTEAGKQLVLSAGTPVSTNLWGFQPSIFEKLKEQFDRFSADLKQGDAREFALPTVINDLIKAGSIRVETRHTDELMFGLTRSEDLSRVRARIADLVASGLYPADLRSGGHPPVTPKEGSRCS
jgi:hypothetical protein